MNRLEQKELSKKLYDELSDKGLVKKHGDVGFLIWKIAFGTACEYFLQTKLDELIKNKMTNQQIIDKHLIEFYEVQKIKVPIELNPYIHRIIKEVMSNQKQKRNPKS